MALDPILVAAQQASADFTRHGASLLVTAAFFAAIWLTASQPMWQAAAPVVSTPIQLVLEELAAPPQEAPPPPTPTAAKPRETAPATVAAPANVAPTDSQTPAPSTMSAPTHIAVPAVAETAHVAPPPTPAPAAAQPETTKPASASLEAEFIVRVRALLNAGKRYPTGREASMQRPQGKVRVWFTLTRSGSLADSGIQDSSNSLLLDNAALATVRRAAFSAFPTEAWAGQEQHPFSAELEFLTPSS